MSPVVRIVPKILRPPLKYFEKYQKAQKRGSLIVSKKWKGDPSALEWFCISC